MIRVALIGTGGIALANHVPGVALCPDAQIVALCDVNPVALERAAQATGVSRTTTDPFEIARDDGVDAVVIATPNRVHHAIALAAIGTGKHVLCEKPIAMTVVEAREMLGSTSPLSALSSSSKSNVPSGSRDSLGRSRTISWYLRVYSENICSHS